MYRSDLKLFNGFLFTDFKYLMAYSIPLTALIGVYLGGYWLFLTPVYIFVLIPITEFILTSFGVDELEKQRSEKVIHWIFDTLLYLNIPIVFGLLFLGFSKDIPLVVEKPFCKGGSYPYIKTNRFSSTRSLLRFFSRTKPST